MKPVWNRNEQLILLWGLVKLPQMIQACKENCVA